MNKKNFYVFLDIDGVLSHYNWLNCTKQGEETQKPSHTKYCPESVSALNFLIKELSKKYNVQLVLSSSLRYDRFFEHTKQKLKNSGVKFNNLLRTDATIFIRREEEIYKYISENDVKNYVVIDDDVPLKNAKIDAKNIIRTNHFLGGLTKKHVENYLSQNCISEVIEY